MVSFAKKVWRDILANKGQFATIFLMTAIGVVVYAGIYAYTNGMHLRAADYYQSHQLPDMWLRGRWFSPDNLRQIRQQANVQIAERQAIIDANYYDTNGLKNTLRLNFIEDNQLSKFYVISGRGFEAQTDGIWLDAYLAQKKQLQVGDRISFKYLGVETSKPIVGTILTPDRIYDVESEGQFFPSHDRYGFAYLSARFFVPEAAAKLLNQPMARHWNHQQIIDHLPFDQVMIKLRQPADFQATKTALEQQFPETQPSPLITTGREELFSYRAFADEMNEGAAYVAVFAGIFLLIASLSVITTMNRLVVKQRPEIGTLKSLGFRDLRITSLYASYGIWLALVACAVGIIVGPLTIGQYMTTLVTKTYAVPNLHPTVPASTYWASLAVIALIGLTSFLACRKQLAEPAATILRPQPPRVASRSLIKLKQWQGLSFASRWNLRDLWRNKLRSLMAMSGIIGTSLLIVCAHGMMDSLNSYINWQFRDLSRYRSRLTLKPDASDQQIADLAAQFEHRSSMSLPIELQLGDQTKLTTITIDDSDQRLGHTDAKRQVFQLSDDGIYVTTKLAQLHGLQVGDQLAWRRIGHQSWQQSTIVGFNRKPQDQNLTATRQAMAKTITYRPTHFYSDQEFDQELPAGVLAVQNLEQAQADFQKMFKMFKSLINLIIIGAAVLGIVVIYNIGSLALIERNYQFATLKVLGFRNRQVGRIFKQQNYWLGLPGIAIGLPLGYLTTDWIFKTALAANYDFEARIQPASYLIGAIGSLVTLAIVNQILSRKIKHIDLVSSLKSLE